MNYKTQHRNAPKEEGKMLLHSFMNRVVGTLKFSEAERREER
jgi:hypothetical protein